MIKDFDIKDFTNPEPIIQEVAAHINAATEKYGKVTVMQKNLKWCTYIIIYAYDKQLKRVRIVDKIQVE